MFEIEHMNETFDYSLVDNETAEFLKEREYTINGIAEDARIKIGRELKKRETRIGGTQRREPYATHGVGLNCWGKIVVKMKCLGGLKA